MSINQLIAIVSCLMFLYSCSYQNTSQKKEISEFWKTFSDVKSEIYSAKTYNNPSIKMLENKLSKLSPKLKLRIGWTYLKIKSIKESSGKQNHLIVSDSKRKRLLAIGPTQCEPESCSLSWKLIRFAENLDETTVTNPSQPGFVELGKNWCITLTQHPHTNDLNEYVYSVDSHIKVDGTKVKFIANKSASNHEFIDVTLYSDLPLQQDKLMNWKKWLSKQDSMQRSIQDYLLEKSLGQYYFSRILGDVLVKKYSQSPPNSSFLPDLHSKFSETLSKNQKSRLINNTDSEEVGWLINPANLGRASRSWHSCQYSRQY